MANNFRLPALFIGHGSPMNALADNDWTRALSSLGKRLPRPDAILCMSAHWLTDGTFITSSPQPRTIHDMHGFPPELYKVNYPAPGAPFLAKQLCDRFPFIQPDSKNPWGFDHGTWSILRFLFPAADVPVLQLSIDFSRNASYHHEMGKQLAALREQGVLLVGSGNIVHNLRAVSMNPHETPFAWAHAFDQWFAQHLADVHIDPLLHDYNRSEQGRLSVPTPDHYYPALFIAGTRRQQDTLDVVYDAIEHGSIAMRSFLFH